MITSHAHDMARPEPAGTVHADLTTNLPQP